MTDNAGIVSGFKHNFCFQFGYMWENLEPLLVVSIAFLINSLLPSSGLPRP